MQAMNETTEISVVVPIYNEVGNIDPFFEELLPILKEVDPHYEVIAIDDGSTDGSWDKLEAWHKKDRQIKLIQFRSNFGQTAAFAAGFDHAIGNTVITIDADRQNDPADIPPMVTKLAEGYDIVAGWRHQRQDAFISRRLPSIIANKLISLTTKVALHDYGCSLKVFHVDVIKNVRLYGEMHRFIPAIASWMGVTVAEMKVNHRPRVSGESKYGIGRTIRVLLDLITVKFLLSYSTRPIQIFGFFGILSGSLGLLLAGWLSFEKLALAIPLANRPALLLAVLLIVIGVQFVSMGLLAELQARTYHESQNKPIYVIRNIRE